MITPALCAWVRTFTAVVLLCLLASCNTTGKPSAQSGPAPKTAAAADVATSDNVRLDNVTPEETTEPGNGPEELIYDPDSLTFDISLSAALRAADNVLFLRTPANVNLNEIPDDLDKWLSRIRDNGGTVKAAPLPPGGRPNRSLLGILIDVVLFFVGLAKDEIIFSAVDDFDAVMYFDKPTGDVKWIVFTRSR
ncbi:hypothetical protein EOI86_02315 [Hwanghaeella grinnelliae]|uniref:Uncharacterized protein n=1 Tax=Hwanghaeella grinnelliae TaxID=2500179 RepID=A0A437QUG1_9PROT|nr:hypothetical protein [Hwanghaeella grinnelliae]RVU38157.1 hypothetical protein EOI86_02315 [Hwanghaeella grinnelliae]